MSQGSPLSRFLTDFRTELAQAVQELASDGRPAGGQAPAPQPPAPPAGPPRSVPQAREPAPPRGAPERREAPAPRGAPASRGAGSTSAPRAPREARSAPPEMPSPRYGTGTRGVSPVAPAVARTVRTPAELRAAVVVSELLGPPRALRPYGSGPA